jgi:hypothetical protein
MANKKEKVPIEFVNVIFFVFMAIVVGIVFVLNGKMHSAFFLILIWITILVITVIIKAIVLSGDREINNKEAGDIFLSSFISTLLIIGSTMLTVNYIPIIGRAFENTVGYWFINNDKLTDALSMVFTKPEELDINLIATQLFYDSNDIDTKNFYNKIQSLKQFSGVTPKDNINFDNKSIIDLYDIIINKNKKSQATIVSLATIAAMYVSYMPIRKPWII